MAETLRELVVSLSLSSDNFNANLKSVNQRIKEAESSFKLASAGVDGFENTMKGAATQFTALKTKLDQQNKAVEQHEQKLKKANDALDKSRESVTKQATSLDDNKRAHAALSGEIAKAEAAFKASAKATGDNSEESIRLSLEVDKLKEKEKALATEIKDGEKKLEAATKSVQRNEDAVSRAQVGLNNAKAEVKETTSALDKLTSGLGKAGAVLGVFAAKAVEAGESMQRMGRTLSTRVTAPLAALGAYALKAAIDFESAFAGVRKTVNATEAEFAQLEQSVKNMSLEVPSTTTVIAGVMEAAGQLGIATENLEDYTRTMIDLGNSTNLAAEEAATAIAKFSNITGMSQGDVGKFGSVLVDLGNNFATTERDIMNMATRLAAAGSQVGMTDTQILAFATGLSSVGIEAEAGGTAFSKAMIQMEVAVATGSEALGDFAKVSGMSKKEFVDAWKAEPAAAIEAFIVGLSKMDEAGISAIATLEDMGISEVRLRDTLLRATNATELFANAQTMAAGAWEDGTALAAEAEQRYNTMASQLEVLKNRVSLAAESLGSEMVPMAKRVIEAVSGLIDRFMALDVEQKEQIIKWGAIAAAAGPALMILGKFASGAGKTVQAVLAITRALRGLSMLQFGWIGLAVAGVAGLTAAFVAANEAWGGFDKTWSKVVGQTDEKTIAELSAKIDVDATVEGFDDAKARVQEIKDWLSGLAESGLLTDEEVGNITDALDGSYAPIVAALITVGVPEDAAQRVGRQIDDARGGVREVLLGLKPTLTEGEIAQVVALIGKPLDEIAGVLAGLGFEVDSAEYAAVASAIENAQQSVRDTLKATRPTMSDAEVDRVVSLIGRPIDEVKAGLKALGFREGTAEYSAILSSVESAQQAVRDALKAVRPTMSEAEIAMVTSLVGKPLEEVKAGLLAFGFEEGSPEYQEMLDAITKANELVDKAFAGIKGIPQETLDTIRRNAGDDKAAVMAALKSLGLSDAEAWKLTQELTSPTRRINEATQGMYDDVIATLTDGLRDDPATIARLKARVAEKFKTLVEAVDEQAREEIAKINPLDPEYQQKVDAVLLKAAEAKAALTGYERDYYSFIDTYAGKHADVVREHAEELMRLTGDVDAVLEYIRQAENEVRSAGKAAFDMTRGGQTLDDDTIGKGFSYAIARKNSALADAEEQYKKDIADLQARLQSGEISEKVYMLEEGMLRAGLEDNKAALIEEYEQALRELFDGLAKASGNAEWGDEVVENLDARDAVNGVIKAIDKAVQEGDADFELDLGDEMLQNALKKAFGEDFDVESVLGDTAIENVYGYLVEAYNLLHGAADEALKSEDAPDTLKKWFDTMFSAGAFGDIDTSDAEAQTRIMAGNIGEALPDGMGIGVRRGKQKATDAADELGGGVLGHLAATLETHSPSRATYRMGGDLVDGLVKGVKDSTWKIRLAMIAMAQEAIKAAKNALGIASPSTIFRDEIGKMMVRGVGVGVESETEAQRRTIANAARAMTASARDGVRVESGRTTNDNRNQSVTVKVDSMNINNRQDIETLAQRINALQRRAARGVGF